MLIFLFTPVSLNDVLSVGIIPFLLSFLATMMRIFLQAVRFYYFVRKFIGKNVSSFWKIIFARLAGEFVTQTTPSYIGGELVRIAFLTKSGVPAGRAAWGPSLPRRPRWWSRCPGTAGSSAAGPRRSASSRT